MILEEETFEAYGYYPSDLKPQSNKPVLAACIECRKIRETSKSAYHSLCKSCANKGEKNPNYGVKMSEDQKAKISAAMKGRTLTEEHRALIGAAHKGAHHTEETKALMSISQKGEKNHNFGKHPSEATRVLWRIARKGENNPRWNGGKRLARARSYNKRKRDLGYTLLMPLKEGEVGHHFTDEYVIGIPVEVHEKFSGYKRRKHRALVFQWLKENDVEKYKIILCILNK